MVAIMDMSRFRRDIASASAGTPAIFLAMVSIDTGLERCHMAAMSYNRAQNQQDNR